MVKNMKLSYQLCVIVKPNNSMFELYLKNYIIYSLGHKQKLMRLLKITLCILAILTSGIIEGIGVSAGWAPGAFM